MDISMRNTQLPVQVGNETQAEKYVDDIQEELQKPSNAWSRIGDIFAAARDQFGRSSTEMDYIAKKLKFSIVKIDKLIKISADKRLESYHRFFGSVPSWTVLYDVTNLNDDQFTVLTQKLQAGERLTSRLVTSIRKPKVQKKSNQMHTLATVQMDINAIRTGIADQEDYEALMGSLQDLANRIPFVKLIINDLLSNDILKREKEVQREYDAVARKVLTKERKRFLDRLKPRYSLEQFKKRKREIIEETDSYLHGKDYVAAFEYIESDEFDQGKFWEEATRNMWKKREKKFGHRVSEGYFNEKISFK